MEMLLIFTLQKINPKLLVLISFSTIIISVLNNHFQLSFSLSLLTLCGVCVCVRGWVGVGGGVWFGFETIEQWCGT